MSKRCWRSFLTVRATSHEAWVLRSDWLMTFFDDPSSHGHDVSIFGTMGRNWKSHVTSKFLARHFLMRDVKTIKRELSLARHDEWRWRCALWPSANTFFPSNRWESAKEALWIAFNFTFCGSFGWTRKKVCTQKVSWCHCAHLHGLLGVTCTNSLDGRAI